MKIVKKKSFDTYDLPLADETKEACHVLNVLSEMYLNMNNNFSETVFTDNNKWLARDTFDDEGCESETNSESYEKNDTFKNKLTDWSIRNKIANNAVSELLSICQPLYPDLPKDARTLLRTQRKVDTTQVAGGDYYYFGLQYWLKILLKQHEHAHVTQQLTLQINIDGIPLFKSSKISLWPILGYISEFKSEPFPIAVYCSDKKPDPIKNYMKDFIEEQLVLQQTGFLYEGVLYKIKLDAVICDAPARALVKCITTHNGYHCCERCVQRGEWCQKVILPTLDAPLRTDISFYEQKDKKHHCKDISPFVELGFGMVTCFPLDYMHLICLGVMRRLLHCWLNGPRGHHAKLPHNIIGAVSDLLVNLRPHIPREFARKPRSPAEYKLWKATELRLFLLYTGPVVLKGFLSPAAYANF